MADERSCSQVRELLPEIAAGVAAGDERAGALRHLSGCRDCRAELGATAEAVDELIQLAPSRRPPEGFQNAVLARMAPHRDGRRASARPRGGPGLAGPARLFALRVAGWAAVAASAAFLAAGAVWWGTSDDRRLAADFRETLDIAHGREFSAAPLVPAGGTEIATIFAYEGDPSWLYATFRKRPAEGRYDVRLITHDGRHVALKPLETTGYLGWASRLAGVRIRDIHVIEFQRSGSPAMSARFGK